MPKLILWALISVSCVACIKPPAVASSDLMSSANWHHPPDLKTCISCHESLRPMGKVGTKNFDHLAYGALGDCVSCHAVDRTRVGVTWALQ
jgi:cytochrome c553